LISDDLAMHDFHYKNGQLYCEQVPVSEIAEQVGTPFYLYSRKTITDHYAKLEKAFRSVNPLICFSMKSNSNLAFLSTLVRQGAGLDIVSGGELYRALNAGCPPEKIVYAGVGKTRPEISQAIDAGILLFNVESIPELETIDTIARSKRQTANVSLRINPGIDPKTHRHITTGKKGTKFGIDFQTAFEIFLERNDLPNLNISGLHVHIGSQITSGDPFVKALKKVLDFVKSLEKEKIEIQYLNLGGGLAAVYHEENPQSADQYAARLLPLLRKTRFADKKHRRGMLIFEPGRFIAANSGIFVTSVLYVKKTREKNFVIVDGGMNDLIRPALYDAYHEIASVKKPDSAATMLSDVVGPICESGDFLGTGRKLPVGLNPEDLLAVFGTGAYGFTMSSQYNSRPRSPEVMVSGRYFEVVRTRETYRDLVRGERPPIF